MVKKSKKKTNTGFNTGKNCVSDNENAFSFLNKKNENPIIHPNLPFYSLFVFLKN